MQDEIAALGVGIVKDYNYLVCLPEHSNDHMFSGVVWKPVEEGRLAKINIYKESKQTVNVYADGRQSRLNALKKVEEEAFVTPTFVVQAVSDAPPVLVPDSRESNGSQGHTLPSLTLTSRLTLLELDLSSSRLSCSSSSVCFLIDA